MWDVLVVMVLGQMALKLAMLDSTKLADTWAGTLLHSSIRDSGLFGHKINRIFNDLTTQTISLSAGQNSQLSFWTTYDIESQWDGGVIEVSTDNTNWTQNVLSPPNPNSFRESSDGCGYQVGTPSFSGANPIWQQQTMDLSAYSGQDITIRWNYSTDGSQNNGGWFLDDFMVTHAQIASQCFSINVIYKNGFE